MYALFTGIPLVGHLNPLIRQATALQRRGWRVALASAGEVRAHVAREAPDLPFVTLAELGPLADGLRRDQEQASLDGDFIRGTARIVRGLTGIWQPMFDGLRAAIAADRPDVVVSDVASAFGVCAADEAGVTLVVNNPCPLQVLSVRLLPPADHLPLLFSPLSIREIGWRHRLTAPFLRQFAAAFVSLTHGRELNALRRSRGLPPVDIHERLRGRLILVDAVFGLEHRRPLPDWIQLVGPMVPDAGGPLPPELDAWLSDGPPVVYANLGTLSVAPAEQLAKMAEALGGGDWRALWVVKEAQQARLPRPLAPSIRVIDWGPPPVAVVSHPNVKVFVSHCGTNSVYESLYAGTPIVGIPMIAEQRDNAIRIADAGAGLWLDKQRFTAAGLRDAIARVMQDDRFRQPLPALRAAIVDAGGVERAATLIEQAAAVNAAPA
jgi:MGT family glycosyltransferase